MVKEAVLLFSGGIDSTTALYWSKKKFEKIHALIFRYSQRHSIEVDMAEKIASDLEVKYRIFDIPFKILVRSALINSEQEIPESLSMSKNKVGIPFTYVPFRNGIFLSLAAAYAESRNILNIITGFNIIDTPDYPDTTEEFTRKMEAAINQGTSASLSKSKFKIFTPLIDKTKREILEFGFFLDADYSFSVSCYRGFEIPCLRCPSCEIRAQAFRDLNKEDPLVIRLKKEGKL